MAPASASFGIAFGILASTAGLGSLAPIVMSATTFAGSAQFAAASVLHNGGSVATAVVAAVLLNARYLAVSLAVAGAFEGSRLRRLLESQLIVDESWAVAQRGGGRFDRRILVAAGLVLYPCWVGATALGVFGGGLLGKPGAVRPRRRVSRALPGPPRLRRQDPPRDRRRVRGWRRRARPAPVRTTGRARDRCRRRLPRGAVEAMSATWIVVLVVGAFTISFKAAGPVLLAGRQLPARLTSAFELLAPSLLAALVVTQSVGGKDGIVLDARLVGLGAAAVAIRLRAPLIVVVVVAALTTALVRAL